MGEIMTSKILYAIYHPDSGLFYTGSTLAELGINTRLYDTKYKAYYDMKVNHIGIKLTWDYFEKAYNVTANLIDIDTEEYNNTLQIFKCLKVVPITLGYNQA